MNGFDYGIIALAVLAAFGGWRMGFLARVFSWVGMGAGLYLAVRFLPDVVNFFNLSGSVARVALAVAVLLAGAFIGQGLGLMVGSRLHAVLPFGGIRTLDRAVGSLLGVVGIFAVLWLLAPSLAAVPGPVSELTTGSVIARWVTNEARAAGRRPPHTLQALRRRVGENGAPQGGLTTAVASPVKVKGAACGLYQEGSGWTVAANLVVTNAHVVAGEPPGQTSVLLPGGATKPATVVVYNPDVDLALLYVPGLGEPPLKLGSGARGLAGAVLGHPNGQDALAVQPASIATEVTALGEDLYDTRNTQRNVFVLAAKLTYGDSGAPLVDTQGDVVGIAFAIAPDRSTTAYALSSSELRPLLDEPRSAAVSTEACLND